MKELEALHRRSPQRRRRARALRREEEARGAWTAKRYYGLFTTIYQLERRLEKQSLADERALRRGLQSREYLWHLNALREEYHAPSYA